MANPTKPTVRVPTLPQPMKPGEAKRAQRALSRPPRKNLLFPHFLEDMDLFDSSGLPSMPWYGSDGFLISALVMGVVGLAGLANRQWGSRAEEPKRIYLVGGSKKYNPLTIAKIEALGVAVIGSEGEARTGRRPRAGNVDAILVLRNVTLESALRKARLMADKLDVPIVLSDTHGIKIESALRKAGLLPPSGSPNRVSVPQLVQGALRSIEEGRGKSAFDSLVQAEVLHHLGDEKPTDNVMLMSAWYALRQTIPQRQGSRAQTGPGDRWTKKNAAEAYRSIQDAVVALRNEQQRNIPCTLFLLLDTPAGRQMKSVAIVFGHPSEIEPAVHTLLETARPAYSVLVGEGVGLDVATEQDAWRAIEEADPRRFVQTVYARLDGPDVHMTQIAMILYELVQLPWRGEDVADAGMMLPGRGGAQA